jgi:hypothetical protein
MSYVDRHDGSSKEVFPESRRWILFSHRIQGRLTDAEADQLFKLARHHTPNQCPVAVELGSWKGKSSVMIAADLRSKGCPKLYCIDPLIDFPTREGPRVAGVSGAPSFPTGLRLWGEFQSARRSVAGD